MLNLPKAFKPRRLLSLALSLLILAAAAVTVAPPFTASALSGEGGFTVERWRMRELTFTAQGTYADPFGEVTLDVKFTGPNNTVLVMPGFWDGGGTWRVRFAPTLVGVWTYETVCSNTSDAGLHGVAGTFKCVYYTGELEIYKRGFVKTMPGLRYFVYDDGTPFFWLGDTHATMPKEPFDDMFKTVVDTRAAQGFTVYQSEPLAHPLNNGPGYDLRDGLQEADLPFFADIDRRFDYIANAGLSHANMQLFFTSEPFNGNYPEAYLRQLARYWVARYAAYPVMWITAQEVDDDFYGVYAAPAINPWLAVAAEVAASDPYKHPLSAHQEARHLAELSTFKNVPGYSFYAMQWSQRLHKTPFRNIFENDFLFPKSFRMDGGGLPAIAYETRFENLWTKNFGARVQGWSSFLNGLCGYGYGAIDIWFYDSNFDMDTTSTDQIDTITPEDKAVKWTESLYFETPAQLNIMKNFLQDIEWWTLFPRYDSWNWFIPWQFTFARGARYSIAAKEDNSAYVVQLFNRNRATGLLRGLKNGAYKAEWFNPRTGESVPLKDVRPFLGMYAMPMKPDKEDWVFYLYR